MKFHMREVKNKVLLGEHGKKESKRNIILDFGWSLQHMLLPSFMSACSDEKKASIIRTN
ncbi:hypothetical protein BDC45DRAFT_518858 [Circinella umbellata]|nr:hypothetical protein BDC45DRAFT_518858 [Circinella umbellata]